MKIKEFLLILVESSETNLWYLDEEGRIRYEYDDQCPIEHVYNTKFAGQYLYGANSLSRRMGLSDEIYPQIIVAADVRNPDQEFGYRAWRQVLLKLTGLA